MTPSAEQIQRMGVADLWPYLVKHMPTEYLFQKEASAYGHRPVQWHLSMDGDYYLEADLTVSDCGNEARAAGFMRGMMLHIAREGEVVTSGLFARKKLEDPAPEDEDEEERLLREEVEAETRREMPWAYQPEWVATAMIGPRNLFTADSMELALLRAFVAWKEGAEG